MTDLVLATTPPLTNTPASTQNLGKSNQKIPRTIISKTH